MSIFDWLAVGIGLAFYIQLGWTWAEVYGRVYYVRRRLTRRRQAGLILFWPVSMMLACDEPE
ncbi:hypothetical protein QMA77_19545 [Pantoea ananatis]|uniref:hypothetical protein n=1 Tax=Pantoea ananas TaxID=553 RepID=UPI0024AD688A|nr:hypothetical protein [Pantoea ananatis]MDI6539120.1 hypothetical protein [Pantoea ananatis]